MEIEGNYQADGYALVRGLVPTSVAGAFMALVRRRLPPGPIPIRGEQSPILDREAFEIYGNQMPAMKSFLWGLTPAMEQITGRALVPTYDYFRIYRQGDICRVHRDRPACEHSLSLTLGYSDGEEWPLEVGREGEAGPGDLFSDDFGSERNRSLGMQIGDAVAYRGVTHRHGRTTPNPNRWSAHLFLHWVDPEGPFASQAFDGAGTPQPVDFTFADAAATA